MANLDTFSGDAKAHFIKRQRHSLEGPAARVCHCHSPSFPETEFFFFIRKQAHAV